MLTNKEELQIKKLLKSFNCGSFNTYVPGTNIEFEPQGCNIMKINSSGGGSDNSIITLTYEELFNLSITNSLVPNQTYRFEFQSIYDQAITELTKTGDPEWLVVKAMTNSQLFPIAFSETEPTDIIHYDINITQTTINLSPTKGKITFRKDAVGNEADFDFRNILMWDNVALEDKLLFNENFIQTNNKIGNPFGLYLHPLFGGYEFTNCIFDKEVNYCHNNLLINSHCKKNVYFVVNSVIADLQIVKDLSKINATSLYQIISNDAIDRMFGGYALFCYFGGIVYLLDNAGFLMCSIDGELRGINDVDLVNVNCNCNIHNITGISSLNPACGMDTVTITGSTINSTFGNVILNSVIQNKTITEAAHPVLFTNVTKTVYLKDNGELWYSYIDNSNTTIFTQII